MSVEVVKISTLKVIRSKLKFALNMYAERHPLILEGERVIRLDDVKDIVDRVVNDKKVV